MLNSKIMGVLFLMFQAFIFYEKNLCAKKIRLHLKTCHKRHICWNVIKKNETTEGYHKIAHTKSFHNL